MLECMLHCINRDVLYIWYMLYVSKSVSVSAYNTLLLGLKSSIPDAPADPNNGATKSESDKVSLGMREVLVPECCIWLSTLAAAVVKLAKN